MNAEQFLNVRYERLDELYDEIKILEPGTKEYEEACDEAEKVLSAIERTEKNIRDAQTLALQQKNTENELAIKQAQVDVDRGKVDAENRKSKLGLAGVIFTGIVAAFGTGLATWEGVWGTKRITQYEETGAVTSKAYQGTIHKPKWKN